MSYCFLCSQEHVSNWEAASFKTMTPLSPSVSCHGLETGTSRKPEPIAFASINMLTSKMISYTLPLSAQEATTVAVASVNKATEKLAPLSLCLSQNQQQSASAYSRSPSTCSVVLLLVESLSHKES